MRWGQFRLRSTVHLISRLRLTASPHRGSLWRFQKSFKRLVDCTDLQLPISIFFCFSKRKRWCVRNDHGGTSRRKRRLFSSVLISSFPNRKLNLRFGFFYANLQQPLSQPSAASSPARGAFGVCKYRRPMQKGADQQIRPAPSIDCKYSN